MDRLTSVPPQVETWRATRERHIPVPAQGLEQLKPGPSGLTRYRIERIGSKPQTVEPMKFHSTPQIEIVSF